MPLALVTGANSGIGLELSRQLLAAGYGVILACRSADAAAAAAGALRRHIAVGAARDRLRPLACDLSSFESVRAAAAAVRQQLSGGALDVLCCNAAAIPRRLEMTSDGFEMQAQVNHLAHFLLTHLLLPSVARSEAGRVVLVSSEQHRKVPLESADPDALAARWRGGGGGGGGNDSGGGASGGGYDAMQVYATTKLQNVWLAEHLATLLPPNVTANAVTPGWVPGTGLGRHLAGPVLSALAGCLGPRIFPSVVATPRDGAARVAAVCMGTDEAEGHPNGLYFTKRRPTMPSAAAVRADWAARAFELSAAALGIPAADAMRCLPR